MISTVTHAALRRSLALLAPLTTASFLAAAASLLAHSASAQEKDSIQFKDGKTESGLIKSEEYAGITFNPAKGAARTVEWKDVAPNGITYAGSAEFQSAKDAYDGGKFGDALPKLQEILGDAKLRAVFKQNAEYFVATIHQRGAEFDPAIESYKKLVADFPKSRWLMEVGEGLVSCYMAKKDPVGAGKALEELSNAATTAGVEASFNSAVNVLKGRLNEEQGKFAEAQAAYGVVAKANGVPVTIGQKARLGEARCMVALNKKADAKTAFQALVKEDAPNGVLAGAWNGIADLTVEEARASQNDAEKLLDALFCYMRGVVQYSPLPGEPVTEYKRALRGSAEVCKFIGQVEKNKERSRLYLERSKEREDQFKKEFPNG